MGNNMMIIDFHTHIFPEEIRTGREKFFSGEPAFELLYGNPGARMAGARELVEKLRQCGVDKAVVFGFPWESDAIARMHNDYVLEAAGRYPEFLVPFACAGISSGKGVSELSRCALMPFKGIGELAFYTDDDPAEQLRKIAPVVDICRTEKLILLVHSNEPVGHKYPGKAKAGLKFYYDLACMCRNLPLVLAHWGGGLFFYNLLKKEAPEVLKNVYYDTAASPYLYRKDIYDYAVKIAGVEKIVFGSDFPLLSPDRYFKELSDSGVPEDQANKIKGENALKLLNYFEAR